MLLTKPARGMKESALIGEQMVRNQASRLARPFVVNIHVSFERQHIGRNGLYLETISLVIAARYGYGKKKSSLHLSDTIPRPPRDRD